MSKLRRYHTAGNWYFITCVTYDRRPILVEHAELLKFTFERAREMHGFDIHAWVIIPDHFHLVLVSRSADLSSLMKSIKASFASHVRSKQGQISGRTWQNRFWDHILRGESDFNTHVDYTHINPVKHGLVASPFEWPHSSIHRFLNEGHHTREWGVKDFKSFEGDFGE